MLDYVVYIQLSISPDLHKQKSAVAGEVSLTREKKMVDRWLIKSGMPRFSFLIECCTPGSLPDPQLVAAMLDLVSTCSFVLVYNTNL